MRPTTRQPGFTLVEVLLSLVILAMLLAAIGAAFHSSLQGYSENAKSAALTQTARAVMDRMMREVRTAADLDSTGTTLTIQQDETGLNRVQYLYTAGSLVYVKTVNGTPTTYPLLAAGDEVAVTSFAVVRQDSPTGDPLSVTVRLALTCGGRPFALTASSAVRRFQTY